MMLGKGLGYYKLLPGVIFVDPEPLDHVVGLSESV